MLFRTPDVDPSLLDALDAVRATLIARSGAGGPVIRRLRRDARASAWAASTSIEGFRVPEDAVALANREASAPTDDADRAALSGYALAMEHVGVLATDPDFRWIDRVLLDLHFEACSFQRDHGPGLLRTGPVYVTRPGDTLPYAGPPASEVRGLLAELVEWLDGAEPELHPAVRAAMTHLHLVSIHPFRDGNGRLARIAQSLVLALAGPLPPELGSIEPYLARNTGAYYAALIEVQGPAYDPERDATPWVSFCLAAHLAEARTRLDQLDRAARRWVALEALVAGRGWPDRLAVALEQALHGVCTRATYAAETDTSVATASTDLRRLVDAGLLVGEGRGRATRYRAAPALRDAAR